MTDKADAKKDAKKEEDKKSDKPPAEAPEPKPNPMLEPKPKPAAPKPKKDKAPEPFSAKGVTKIEPVAKGEKCVVINPHARCFTLSGVEPIKPGRNTRDTEAVTIAMYNDSARKLGLVIQELGDPEKEDEATAVSNVLNTYDVNALKQMQDVELRPKVLNAIAKQIRIICPTKEDLEKVSE